MERKSIQLRPNRVVTRSTLTIPPSQRLARDVRIDEAVEKKPENHFGILAHRAKTLNMDLLTKRILKKGSKEFEPPVKELIGEVPPGCENGVLLTHSQVCRMFDVTGMTVYDWRKRLNLPVIVLSGGRRPPVRYDEGVVLAWAELHGRKVLKHDYREWV